MSINEINGNLFDSKADVLCHQVNTYGVMGAGIAKEVKQRFPFVFEEYKELCSSVPGDEFLLGDVLIVQTDPRKKQFIANCFGQIGWNTDYETLKKSLLKLRDWMDENRKKTVAFPYKMSCGLAGGNWETVRGLIESVFDGTGIDVEIWKLEKLV